jgi:RNase P subunit RPR2
MHQNKQSHYVERVSQQQKKTSLERSAGFLQRKLCGRIKDFLIRTPPRSVEHQSNYKCLISSCLSGGTTTFFQMLRGLFFVEPIVHLRPLHLPSWKSAKVAPMALASYGPHPLLLKLATSTTRTPRITGKPACIIFPPKTKAEPGRSGRTTEAGGVTRGPSSQCQKAVPPPSKSTFSGIKIVKLCPSVCGRKLPPL